MRVFVETNFVLEMAFKQKESNACQEILRLAESNAIQLNIPAYCFIEPAEKLRREIPANEELQDRLLKELDQRQRTEGFDEEQKKAWNEVIASLVKSTQEAEQRMRSIRTQVLECADVVPVGSSVIERAATFQQGDISLHFPDAVVLASVMVRLESAQLSGRQALFLNRNSKDFDVSSVKRALKQLHCKLITSFDDGLAAIQAGLRSSSG